MRESDIADLPIPEHLHPDIATHGRIAERFTQHVKRVRDEVPRHRRPDLRQNPSAVGGDAGSA